MSLTPDTIRACIIFVAQYLSIDETRRVLAELTTAEAYETHASFQQTINDLIAENDRREV